MQSMVSHFDRHVPLPEKKLSCGNVSVDKPKVLLTSPGGAAAVNIDGTTIHTALNFPVGHFKKNLPLLS